MTTVKSLLLAAALVLLPFIAAAQSPPLGKPVFCDGTYALCIKALCQPIVGKNGPLDTTLGVCDFIAAFKTDGKKEAAIKKFLDFAMQDKYQVAFAKEYNLLPGTTSGAAAFVKVDPALASFVNALPKAVQYPNAPVWAQVKTQIQQLIGTAIGPHPKAVLDNLQETALKGS